MDHNKILRRRALMIWTGLSFSSLMASELSLKVDGAIAWDNESDRVKSELALTPRVDASLSENTEVTLSARFRFDEEDNLISESGSSATRSEINRVWSIGKNGQAEIRDLYLDQAVGDFFFRLGKQQVVWGQADGVRVLDVVNPVDYREFILPPLEDRRVSLWMLNADGSLASGNLQVLLIPDTTYDVTPIGSARYSASSPLLVPRPPVDRQVRLQEIEKPDNALDTGIRWQTFVGGWDVSLNYLYHFHDQPVYRVDTEDEELLVTPEYERTHLVGGSLSNAYGDFVVRGELGYSTDRYWIADFSKNQTGVVGSPELAMVAGLDYSGSTNTFGSVQLHLSQMSEGRQEAVREEKELTWTVLIRRQLMNQSLALEAFAVQSVNRRDSLVQLQASYTWNDHLNVYLSADAFSGDRDGLYGQYHENDQVTIGVNYHY